MKRTISFLLTLILIIGMVPFSAMAFEPAVMSETYTYINPLYADVITEADLNSPTEPAAAARAKSNVVYHATIEAAAAEMRAQMAARQEMVVVHYQTKKLNASHHSDIFEAAIAHTGKPKEGDELRWNYGGYGVGISKYEKNGVTYATFTYAMTYYTNAKQEEKLDAAVKALLATVDPKWSDYEKLRHVYEWMCANITYDYSNSNGKNYLEKYTAYGAMINKTAVCQGYAVLLYRLALELGIDCRVITGTGNSASHAWNIVKFGKAYYNLDATWDAIWYQGSGRCKYFLKSEKTFAEDHFRDAAYNTKQFHQDYPMGKADYKPETKPSNKNKLTAPTVTSSNKASTGKIVLTWKAVNGAVKYEIYRSASKNGTFSRLKSQTDTTYTNTSAKAGSNYYYYVRAIDAKGNYADSSIISHTCDLAQTKATLSNVASTGKIKISWEAVEGATKYEVYRANSKKGSYTKLTTTTSLSYKDAKAVAGKTYYYKVRAICKTESAAGAYSEVKSCTCGLARPEVKASNVASSGKIKISWKSVTGAVKYEVYRATSKNGSYKKLTTTTETSITNNSVTAGKTYYYKVKAIAEKSAANSAFSEVTSCTCDLGQPKISIALNAGKPKISWDKVDGAVSYQVYRAASKNGSYSRLKTTTSLSYKDTKASSGKTYYYKVFAVCSNTSGNSAYSKVVSIKATK